MTIIKRGNSYWIDFGFNHKRYRKRSPDNTYKGAKVYEQSLRHKLACGQPLDEPSSEEKHTFKEIVSQWFNTYVKNNNKPSEISNKQYILQACLIPYFGNKYIEDISSYSIEQYKSVLLNKSNLSPKSINNRLSILNRCFKIAQEWRILKEIPRIKLMKVPPQKFDYLTETEAELLINYAKGIHHDMILLALRTGLRFGELIALKWADIDLKECIMTVSRSIVNGIEGSPKNNKGRTLPLTASVVNMLKSRPKDDRYIFHNEKGETLKHYNCLKHLYKICKQAGLRRISWHVLRHSFASHLAGKGVSVFSIKELLGHSDIKMTMRYSHINLPILKDAIKALEPTIQFEGTVTAQNDSEQQIFANYSSNIGRDAGN
jgi:integrase